MMREMISLRPITIQISSANMYQLIYEEKPVFLHYIVPNINNYLLLEKKKKEEENTSCLKQFWNPLFN